MKRFSLLLALLLAGSAVTFAAETQIMLPPETAVFKQGAGLEVAQANCITCHSAEYILTQPPMPRKFWEGTVKKMREKYFAPIPEEAVPVLVEYLAATYGAK